MLKRNGEDCQFQVPGFPGRLTQRERTAYDQALASIQDQLDEFECVAQALEGVEKNLKSWAELTTQTGTQSVQSLTIPADGVYWEIHRSLFKSNRAEMLLCSRNVEGAREFSIIERIDPNSAYAKANGSTEVLMTGNDPRLLLQDYVENERQALQLCKSDLEASVAETVTEQFPDQNLSRVVRAISERCNQKLRNGESRSTPERRAQDVKIHL